MTYSEYNYGSHYKVYSHNLLPTMILGLDIFGAEPPGIP